MAVVVMREMSAVSTHKDLAAWQEAMSLVEVVYRETETFPGRETYGLTAQIRRAAVSVPSNIAEGAARNSPRELLQFVSIACGSLAELETQLELASRLGYLKPGTQSVEKTSRVGMLVRLLRKSLRNAE